MCRQAGSARADEDWELEEGGAWIGSDFDQVRSEVTNRTTIGKERVWLVPSRLGSGRVDLNRKVVSEGEIGKVVKIGTSPQHELW